jgi:DNA-binding XRE family transcriptional regulator
MQTLGQRARARREELGLTQKRIAAACGVTQQAYEKLEGGDVRRPRYLPELADILQTSPRWLLTGLDETKNPENRQSPNAGKISVYGYPSDGDTPPLINWESGASIDWIAPLPGMENASKTAALYIQGNGLEPFYKHGYSVFIDRARQPAAGRDCVYDDAGGTRFARYAGYDYKNHSFEPFGQTKQIIISAAEIKGIYLIVGVLCG